jgi:hypothetical protein
MTREQILSHRFILGLIAALLCLATVAKAGPPLICHTIEIGQARSLPWTSHSWNLNGGENYETKNLVRDALEILAPNTPILVRMETLRRATLYGRTDPLAAKELFSRLQARAAAAQSSGHPDALAWFDVGYLAETYKQWIGKNMPHMTDSMRMDPNPAAGIEGYALVKKAIELRGSDPQMEFAAALITLSGPQTEHHEHAQKAIAGAQGDPLLARNLATRFTGPTTEKMAEMLAKNTSLN